MEKAKGGRKTVDTKMQTERHRCVGDEGINSHSVFV